MNDGTGWGTDQYGIRWTNVATGLTRAAAGGMLALASRRGWIITRDTDEGRQVVRRSRRDYASTAASRTACQRALWEELGMQ